MKWVNKILDFLPLKSLVHCEIVNKRNSISQELFNFALTFTLLRTYKQNHSQSIELKKIRVK